MYVERRHDCLWPKVKSTLFPGVLAASSREHEGQWKRCKRWNENGWKQNLRWWTNMVRGDFWRQVYWANLWPCLIFPLLLWDLWKLIVVLGTLFLTHRRAKKIYNDQKMSHKRCPITNYQWVVEQGLQVAAAVPPPPAVPGVTCWEFSFMFVLLKHSLETLEGTLVSSKILQSQSTSMFSSMAGRWREKVKKYRHPIPCLPRLGTCHS